MFKVSEKKDVGLILTPDWGKTSSKRLIFKGFKFWGDEQQYAYAALFNCKATECKQWIPEQSIWKDIDELPNPVLLRLMKSSITYKGKEGQPDKTVTPSEWDKFFIERFEELVTQYPDGLASGILDFTESNLGFAKRWLVETDTNKKMVMMEAFWDIKPITDETVEGLDTYNFEALQNSSNSFKKGGNYQPKETTSEILAARLQFVSKNLALAIDGSDDSPLPLLTYILAIDDMKEPERKSSFHTYLKSLIQLATGGNS